MIKHQIILSSSYSEGTRICMDFVDCDPESFKSVVGKISGAYDGKDVPFSIHTVHTDSEEWHSVVERDPYFKKVQVIETVEQFISIIQKDRYLKGIDVAMYILSKVKCTHTRIEKLTYMCYADYLCSTGERLFDDEICAFEHGPIVYSVYREFKDHSKEHSGETIDEKQISLKLRLPMKSKILFSEDGDKKLDSIDRTLERFRYVRTAKLVALTHRDGSPWSKTIESADPHDSLYTIISDKDILECHHVEGYA